MSWTLNASGHINSVKNDEEGERALAKEIHELLKPIVDRGDLHFATFTGNYVNGSVLTGNW